mmetsp:Transcript_28231/g.40341  ORF Transcript_28231/g.40341 Transcript_28231/m.40341 type:complete len:201 (-) Transcript_28231:772-1374(-)|eukprot:CAMPEP_0201698764 /NCGR_PEP_ID=MMETSP0578-20130828/20694_1 /ASSEMBLY_ACC=CAM_ASM_000663 /TAXON_ID=267565 /ORGANISM="Skeletonema grethea, Strain CCMP 1804" /LENGTH=200 /DNA_ID=CAMNT_0048185379 /DNA_START=145 /DNA_END=747 /DNA_ORIENTATION=-
MAISVETMPSSVKTYSGVINSVLIQTEDGRQYDSSIQHNRIRDHSMDYYHHFQSERPRFVAKPVMLLGMAVFVAVWLFSESNRFAVFPLTASRHKFGKPKVENRVEALYESEKTDEIDALNIDDDLQFDDELAVEEDQISNDTSTTDDDDVLGEDDSIEGDESEKQSKEVSETASATNFTDTSNATTTIESRVNATNYNL